MLNTSFPRIGSAKVAVQATGASLITIIENADDLDGIAPLILEKVLSICQGDSPHSAGHRDRLLAQHG